LCVNGGFSDNDNRKYFEDVEQMSNLKTDLVCISETAMGKKIYAQSNYDSEYVRSVYRYVFFFYISVNMAGGFMVVAIT